MAISTPGIGKNNSDLERRIANLERNLNAYAAIWVTVGMPGGDGTRQQMQVLAKRGSPEEDVSAEGPFCKVYRDETEWKLLGGTVTCGAGTETIADITIGEFGEEIEPPADGKFYWLACDITANEEDDVLLPGGTLNSAVPGSGASLPNNTIPEIGSLSGQIHISLGSWSGGVFIPAGCGNIAVSHCPGSLTSSRG